MFFKRHPVLFNLNINGAVKRTPDSNFIQLTTVDSLFIGMG